MSPSPLPEPLSPRQRRWYLVGTILCVIPGFLAILLFYKLWDKPEWPRFSITVLLGVPLLWLGFVLFGDWYGLAVMGRSSQDWRKPRMWSYASAGALLVAAAIMVIRT